MQKKEIEKLEKSTQNIIDMRISPFFPFQKVAKNSAFYKQFIKNNNSVTRETSWGSIEIRNRILTQHHNDIFNIIMTNAIKTVQLNDGRCVKFFSIYSIAKKLGWIKNKNDWGGAVKNQIVEKILEIRDVVIVRRDKDENILTAYNIISDCKYSQKEDRFGIILTKEYLEFFLSNITVRLSDETLQHIIGIKAKNSEGVGLLKSIINFFLTQKENQKIGVEKILQTIGYDTSPRNIRTAKRVFKKNSEVFTKFGIFYLQDDIFHYTGFDSNQDKITFLPPLSQAKK